jgi:hypothetical protein
LNNHDLLARLPPHVGVQLSLLATEALIEVYFSRPTRKPLNQCILDSTLSREPAANVRTVKSKCGMQTMSFPFSVRALATVHERRSRTWPIAVRDRFQASLDRRLERF